MLELIHVCDIGRNQTVGTNGRKQASTIHSNVSCLVLPMTAAATVSNGFDIGKAFDFYFNADQDVKVGDVLTYSGNTYVAKAVQSYQVPVVGHVHVMAQQGVS